MTHGIGGSDAATELADLEPRPGRPGPVTRAEYEARLARARALLRETGAPALLVGAGASLRYYAGVPWTATERLVALVVTDDGPPAIVCPAFEEGSLEASLAIEAKPLLWQEDESPEAQVVRYLGRRGIDAVALDPALPFAVYERLAAAGPHLRIVGAGRVIDGCRARKSPTELACLQYAKSLTLEVQRRAARLLAPGITTGAVRRFIDAAHRAGGADGGSTFCAVQFGRATAYPHGLPGEQTLAPGDLVLIDTGCTVQGYHSDITRTYCYGDPTPDQRRVFEVEREAQAAAFDAVRPGVACEAIDAAARNVLERHGFGPGYALPGLPHRTGHGIGLSIHEGPYLVRGERTPLAEGMCFSNEPMIVVPDAYGIRLEDHFHVTEDGARWFSEPSPSIDAPFGHR